MSRWKCEKKLKASVNVTYQSPSETGTLCMRTAQHFFYRYPYCLGCH
jgi:hypothetical protein